MQWRRLSDAVLSWKSRRSLVPTSNKAWASGKRQRSSLARRGDFFRMREAGQGRAGPGLDR